jgi:hypothetical protein
MDVGVPDAALLDRKALGLQGFVFCDDELELVSEIRAIYANHEQKWWDACSRLQPLIQRGLVASTTDHPTQSIRTPLLDAMLLHRIAPGYERISSLKLSHACTVRAPR